MAPSTPSNQDRRSPIRLLENAPLRIELTHEEILADLRYPVRQTGRSGHAGRRS